MKISKEIRRWRRSVLFADGSGPVAPLRLVSVVVCVTAPLPPGGRPAERRSGEIKMLIARVAPESMAHYYGRSGRSRRRSCARAPRRLSARRAHSKLAGSFCSSAHALGLDCDCERDRRQSHSSRAICPMVIGPDLLHDLLGPARKLDFNLHSRRDNDLYLRI